MIVTGRALGLCAFALLATPSHAAEFPAARRAGDIAGDPAVLAPALGRRRDHMALSLRRDGSVIGAPRWQLGAIIADQILRIRFVAAAGGGTRASEIWSGI